MPVVVFADNQTILSIEGTPTEITTDPVPLDGNDRVTCISNVHSIFATGVGSALLNYLAEVSNDGGQKFVDMGVTDSLTATGGRKVVGSTPGALLRFKFILDVTGGTTGDVACCCFDLHVSLDHA